MLKLPAFAQYSDLPGGASASVFQDDAQFWRFYIIPGFPQVRLSAGGDPVFMLIKYKHSDAAREEDPDLPAGGGYMVFDAELRLAEEHRARIVDDLQTYVDEHWERLKRMPNPTLRTLEAKATMNDALNPIWSGRGHHGTVREEELRSVSATIDLPGTGEEPPGIDDPAPTVVIGEPLWTEGVVSMTAPESAALVQNKVAERPASLVGNNVAAFSLDLTADGATFMQKTLVSGGEGATDLTPIQVAYKLSFLAKLPSARVYLKFNTGSVYHALQELFHEHDSSGCDDDYFTSETMMSAARESGLIDLKIDMGGVVDEDLQQLLTQQATSQAQQLMVERFANKERAPLEEWADTDLQDDGREIYRLKRQTEVEIIDFEQQTEISPTIEHSIAPQGTLLTFFKGRRDMSAFVREVDLDDPFFKTLQLQARAFAKWAEDQVSFVELEIQYDHGELKTQTFTFTPADNEPKLWDPALVDGKREYKYRWRVGFEGRAAGEWSALTPATTRNLNVAVETPGKLEVEVAGVGLDFENVLDAVLVRLRYGDPSNDVAPAEHSILLSAERGSGTWIRQLYARWDKAIDYRVDYLLKNGARIDTQWASTTGPTKNLLITRPDVDVLDVTLIPAGDWSTVVQSIASVRYSDGAYNRDAQFNFKSAEEFKKWGVLLVDPNKRTFEYKITSTFNNGDTQETDWIEKEGDQALPIKVEGPPRLTVKLSGAVLDYASTPLTKVDVEYADPEGTSDAASFSFQKPDDVHTWSIPVRADGPRGYRYKTTFFPVEGAPVERAWEETETELIVIPRYSIPKVGADFNPVLQDFTKTPAIEVNLKYDDPQRNVHETMTLVFTSKERQVWWLPVADEAPRTYGMTVIWYYADGTQKESTPVSLEKPAVLLPPAPAQAVS